MNGLLTEYLQGYLKIALIFALFFVLVLLAKASPLASGELSRKLLHFGVIAVLCVWLYAFRSWKTAVLAMLAFLPTVYLVLLLAEKADFLTFLRRFASEREPGELRKSLLAAGAALIYTAILGWGIMGQRSLALAAILAWGPGDAAAALVGKRFGRTKIGREKKKSLEGSLAMLMLSFLCVFSVLSIARLLNPGWALIASALTAAAAMVVELYEDHGLDTFCCPAAAMSVLALAAFGLS